MTVTHPRQIDGRVKCRRRAPGFTLLELLVVVGIIGILMAVSLSVGPRIFDTQRAAATRGLLNSLDRMLDEYIDATGAIPPFNPEDYAGVPGALLTQEPDSPTTGPETDADGAVGVRFPAAGVFINQVRGVGQADEIMAALPPRFFITINRDAVNLEGPGGPSGNPPPEPSIPNVLDGWANPEWDAPWPQLEQTLILYVHPRNILAQKLYGRCVNNRPYFMSAGADELYGATAQIQRRRIGDPPFGQSGAGFQNHLLKEAIEGLKDNIYSYQPDPPALTTGFNNTQR